MLKPLHILTLAVGASLCALRGEEVRLAAFQQVDTLYFDRGSMTLSPMGVQKIGQFLQAWGKSGPWVIGIPRNHGASDQVLQGRIRSLVSLLLEHGVVGVHTVSTEPVPREGFEPLLLGKLKVDPWAGIDPNEDQPSVSPHRTPEPEPVPVLTPAAQTPLEPVPPQNPSAGLAPWLALSAAFESASIQVTKPPTATLEAKPYQILGLNLSLSPTFMDWGLGYAQTLYSSKEQTDPTNRLDISPQSTNFYHQFQFFMNFRKSSVPLQLSYLDETSATTAVLPLGTLLVDRQGAAWISLVDGVHFAYKTQRKTYALDWHFGGGGPSGLGFRLGVHLDQVQSPLNVIEYGSYSNKLIYASHHDLVGLHAGLQGDPWREGFHLDALELRYGRATGIHLVDQYHLLNFDPSKSPFNELNVKFHPNYLMNLGRQGFLRITAPLGYSKNTSKTISFVKANGDGQNADLLGTSQRYGLKVELGWHD